MRKSRVLWKILKTVGADKIISGYVGFFLLASLALCLFDSNIGSYGNALWFSFNVATTIGLGDIVVTSMLARIVVVLLSLYSIFVVALVPAVVINYFMEINRIKQQESTLVILDKLTRLHELSTDELKELSDKISKIVK